MIKQTLSIAVICFLFSCSEHKRFGGKQKEIQTDSSAKAASILFANPRIIDSTHIVMYPLILEKIAYETGFSSDYGSSERTSFWNVVFYNTDSQTQHLLTSDKRIAIYEINLNGKTSSSGTYDENWDEGINIYRNNIFYEVVSKDFNQNNQLDIDDPRYLYVSDKKGNGFRQLSPNDYNIINWEAVKGTSKIILQAQKDSNGDNRFDEDDEVTPLVVDIATGQYATETFNQTYIDSLKKVLTTTWTPSRKK